MAVYAAKAPVVVPPVVPPDWPPIWPPITPPDTPIVTPPVIPGGPPIITPPVIPWPPGWPIIIPDDDTTDYSLDIIGDDISAFSDIPVTILTLDAGFDTSDLIGHPLAIIAIDQDGESVMLRKGSGDAWDDAYWTTVKDLGTGAHGFSDTLQFDVDPTEDGTITLYAFIFSVDPYLKASCDVAVNHLPEFGAVQIDGSSSVSASTTTVTQITVNINGSSSVSASATIAPATQAVSVSAFRSIMDTDTGDIIPYDYSSPGTWGYIKSTGHSVYAMRPLLSFIIPDCPYTLSVASIDISYTSETSHVLEMWTYNGPTPSTPPSLEMINGYDAEHDYLSCGVGSINERLYCSGQGSWSAGQLIRYMLMWREERLNLLGYIDAEHYYPVSATVNFTWA